MAVDISEVKRALIELLEKDEEFRERLAMFIMETPMLRELRALREDFGQLTKQMAENSEAIRALQEQMVVMREDFNKRIEELRTDFNRRIEELRTDFNKRIEELREDFNKLAKQVAVLQEQAVEHTRAIRRLDSTLGAIAYRWGLMAEDAFRRAMSGMLEEFGFKVIGKLTLRDEWGIVSPRRPGAVYEYDICITRNGETWLIEVRSSVDWWDIDRIEGKAKLYERYYGVRPRIAIVSPFVSERAREEAEKAGFKVFTYERR